MNTEIYTPFGRPLMRSEDNRVIAMSCTSCGRFTLNTSGGLCACCNLHPSLNAFQPATEKEVVG